MRIILGFILLILGFSVVYAAPPGQRPGSSYTTVLVRSGDTVWNIAGRQVTEKEDIRDIIRQIRVMNHLDNNASIKPGQVLKVPVKKQD